MNNYFMPVTQRIQQLPVYMYALGGTDNQHYILRHTGYQYFHLFFCVEGSGVIKFENTEHIMDTHSIALFMTNEFHEYYPISDTWATRWFVFGGKNIYPLFKSFDIEKSCVFNLNSPSFLENDFNRIYSKAKSGLCPYSASSILYSSIIKLLVNDFSNNNVNKRLSQVIKFIENNYQYSISVENMSQVINVSPQYLCRMFKTSYNMRPFQYLNMIRINKAKQLLTQNNFSILKIAKMCGYNEPSYFCLKFKQLSGVTPKEFRRLYKN